MLVGMVLRVRNPFLCMSVDMSTPVEKPVRSSAKVLNSCKSGKGFFWNSTQGQKLIRHRVSFCYTAHVFFLCFRRMKISLFWLIAPMCFYSLFSKPRIMFRLRINTPSGSSLASPRIAQFSDANLLYFFSRILRNPYSFWENVRLPYMCDLWLTFSPLLPPNEQNPLHGYGFWVS